MNTTIRFILVPLMLIFQLWVGVYLTPKFLISAHKKLSEDCRKTYGIELIWEADWYCKPNKQEHHD